MVSFIQRNIKDKRGVQLSKKEILNWSSASLHVLEEMKFQISKLNLELDRTLNTSISTVQQEKGEEKCAFEFALEVRFDNLRTIKGFLNSLSSTCNYAY